MWQQDGVHGAPIRITPKRTIPAGVIQSTSPSSVTPQTAAYADENTSRSWAGSSVVSQEKVGIGAYFKKVPPANGGPDDLEVKSFLKNSPAELINEISVGDVIVSVDSEAVDGWSLSELAERILDPAGSVVHCKFRRRSSRPASREGSLRGVRQSTN